MISSASDEMIVIKLNDEGTVVGGTDTTPSNRNAGSGNVADATVQSVFQRHAPTTATCASAGGRTVRKRLGRSCWNEAAGRVKPVAAVGGSRHSWISPKRRQHALSHHRSLCRRAVGARALPD